MRLLIATLFLLGLLGCSEQKEKSEVHRLIKQALKTEVSDSFIIKSFDASGALGDYVETYEIVFAEHEFNKIVSTASQMPHWDMLPNGNYQASGAFVDDAFNNFITFINTKNKVIRFQFIWE